MMRQFFFKNLTETFPFYQFLLENSHSLQLVRKSFFYINDLVRKEKLRSSQANMAPSSIELDINPSDSQLYGKALFRRLKKWCDSHKVKLIILTTGYFYDKQYNTEPTIAFYSIASEFFQQENIIYHDISSQYISLTKNNKVKYYISSKDTHPNEKGSQIIADSSWKWLKPELSLMGKN